jgi:histidine triad (HIT) family protein
VHNHEPQGYRCVFCDYLNGRFNDQVQDSHVVERTGQSLAFVSPRWWVNNEGHVIVVPAQHVENLYDLTEPMATPLLAAVRRAALALKSAYGCAGTSVRQHNEPAGDQEIWHLHVHVFPRHADDGLYGSPFRRAEPAEMDSYASRLRAAYRATSADPWPRTGSA